MVLMKKRKEEREFSFLLAFSEKGDYNRINVAKGGSGVSFGKTLLRLLPKKQIQIGKTSEELEGISEEYFTAEDAVKELLQRHRRPEEDAGWL